MKTKTIKMENFGKYIQDNLEQFNTGEIPAGHQERFMAKLQTAQAGSGQSALERKAPRLFSRRSLFAATAAAAAIIIAFLITPGSLATKTDEYTIAIQEAAEDMYLEETEILIELGENDQHIINSIKSITEEAIPLSEQLPEELSPEKRAQILREYYKARTAALKNFRTLAHSNEIID